MADLKLKFKMPDDETLAKYIPIKGEKGERGEASGAPIPASSTSEMTDTTRTYVNTSDGHWYYYDGSSWADGGIYQSTGVQTDKTLSVVDEAADAQYTGLIGNALTDPAKVILPLLENVQYNRANDTYTANTKVLTTHGKVNFDDFVEITPPDGYTLGAFLIEASGSTVYNFAASPITLIPNKDWVIVLRNTDSSKDIDVITGKKLKIKYGGTVSNAMTIHGETTSYDFDANACMNDGRYFIRNGDGITLKNFPRNNENVILINHSSYTVSRAATQKFMLQEVYYPTSNETWTRLLSTNSHTGWKPWVKVSPPSLESALKGKKVSFYGDSITTFAGYIPDGNATYYTGSNAGVTNVDQTWWKKTIDALGLNLIVNNSWSGRRVSEVGRTDDGYKQENIEQLASASDTPEIIIIKLGINDFNNNIPLGDYSGNGKWGDDPTKFSNAYAIMLHRIMTTFPLAKIYCCTLNNTVRGNFVSNPTINGNGVTLAKWNERIKDIAGVFGAEIIDHNACGITEYNLSTYAGDYNATSGTGLHPNAAGMSLIANMTIEHLDNATRTRY